MTIAHRWNSGEQTIPMRYGTIVGELIRRSSALETPARLALEASYSTACIWPSLPTEMARCTGGEVRAVHRRGPGSKFPPLQSAAEPPRPGLSLSQTISMAWKDFGDSHNSRDTVLWPVT